MSQIRACIACNHKPKGRTATKVKLQHTYYPLFKDYLHAKNLANNLNGLPFDCKVKYLESRAKLVMLDPLREELRMQKVGLMTSYHLLSLVTILCCAIEGLGHYLLPSQKTTGMGKKIPMFKREYFKEFVVNFMDPQFQLTCPSTGDRYYDHVYTFFRCGLAHGFCIEKGGIEQHKSWYFHTDPTLGLQIDIDRFVNDFRRGFKMFFERLRLDGPAGRYGRTFQDRFYKLFITL